MLYRQKKDTYIRNYDGLGYITSTGMFNDRIVNQSGTIFLTALNRNPQTLDQLVDKIFPQFVGIDRETIKNDVEEFYDVLFEDGFIVKGNTEEELNNLDKGFSYSDIVPKTIKSDFSPAIKRADNDTQEYLEEYFKEKPQIINFQIELTSRCNERCVHCYIPHKYKLYDISEELYYSVLDQINKMQVLNVTLSGGEPMMHPKFVEFLRAAKKHDFYVNVLSNLTLLNDEIVEALKEGNVSSVQVSLYSMNPEHHDAITKMPGSFEKTKNSILKLIDNGIPVQVSCPTMKGNKDDYKDVMNWCHEHKIRAQTDYVIMAEYNHDTSNLANRLSIDEVGNVIKSIVEEDRDYQEGLLKDNFMDMCDHSRFSPEKRLCGVGISTCCMVANGNVYPCPGWQGMVLGNLMDDSLENIWRNSPKIQWLRSLKLKDMGNGKCSKCENVAFCSPCMVRNANESPTGNPLEINNHFCAVAELNKKIILDWRDAKLKELGK